MAKRLRPSTAHRYVVVHTDARDLLDYLLIYGGLALIVLSYIGERQGWWNDLGAFWNSVGIVASVIGLGDRFGRRALAWHGRHDRALERLVEGQRQVLGKQDAMLGKQDAMLGKQDAQLKVQVKTYRVGRETVAKQQATIDALDRITTLLDDRLPRG